MATTIFTGLYTALKDKMEVMVPAPLLRGNARGATAAVWGAKRIMMAEQSYSSNFRSI